MSEKIRPTTDDPESIDEKTSSIPLSRRGMLVTGGLLGASLLGGTGTASANHEDDGDLFAQEGHDHHGEFLGEYTPVDRIDANQLDVEEIYNKQGSTATMQTAWDGLVVPVAPGLGMVNAVNPEQTATPIQDAIDALPSNGGTVLLPPETVVNEGSIHMRSGVSIQGWGYGFTPDETLSEIYVPNENADLIRFDEEVGGMRGCRLDGFQLQGPILIWPDFDDRDPDDTTGVGIRFGDENRSSGKNPNIGRLHIGRIRITGLQNAAMKSEPGSKFTECYFENITAERIDAGNATALFDFSEELGVGAHFGIIGAYPVGRASGVDSNIVHIGRGGEASIRHLNVGGGVNRLLTIAAVMGEYTVDQINFESRHQLESSDELIYLSGDGNVNIGSIQLRRGTTERVYRLDNTNWQETNGHNVLGPINWAEWRDTPFTAAKPIAVDGDTTHSTIYMGPSKHIGNNTGSELSTPIACLGDLTKFTGA